VPRSTLLASKAVILCATYLVLGVDFAPGSRRAFAAGPKDAARILARAPLPERRDLSKQPWMLRLDAEASWTQDPLHLPPVDLEKVATSEPTGGWSALARMPGKRVRLPATVEGHFWARHGNPTGIAGDYTGVSWFSTSVAIPRAASSKRVSLHFDSVQVRAEIFVNRQLVGYDIIAGTPFEVDITRAVRFGARNHIDVRITENNGVFTWRDYLTSDWGQTETPPRHGFGGITGRVYLQTDEPLRIEDVFVKNTPHPRTVVAEVTLNNAGANTGGRLIAQIVDRVTGRPLHPPVEQTLKDFSGRTTHTVRLTADKAQLWSPESPHLYTLRTAFKSDSGTSVGHAQTFGFRWFERRFTDGDAQFFLNGSRVVLKNSISWGYWPVDGAFPSEALGRKQIRVAKKLGLNMLSFHRHQADFRSLHVADELGLLAYEEPGGYGRGESDFVRDWNRIKAERIIQRDRNHPSLVIYDLMNEAARDPTPRERREMAHFHKLDETRFMTFSSQYYPKDYHDGHAPQTPSPGKLFAAPYEHKLHDQGWWDEHHAGGHGVWSDDIYENPETYQDHTTHRTEILFLGEEGAIGTPGRFGRIARSLRGKRRGWDGDDVIALHEAYADFLRKWQFTQAFPTVDALTTSLAAVSHDYHGRRIENIRLGNLIDGYTINGWEETKLENHSGIVDTFRNPKADPQILAHYLQPLYVAVKPRRKVIARGQSSTIDFFFINERNAHGPAQLHIDVQPPGAGPRTRTFDVRATGGATFGELLVAGVTVTPQTQGYTTVSAELHQSGQIIARGRDRLFAIDTAPPPLPTIDVNDSRSIVRPWLAEIGVTDTRSLTHANQRRLPEQMRVLVVADPPSEAEGYDGSVQQPLLDWVARGNALVVIDAAPQWARFFGEKEIIDERGSVNARPHWYGGNFFVRNHPLFAGLPTDRGFGWVYQTLARYSRKRVGLRLTPTPGLQTVVGLQVDHRPELFSAVVTFPHGEGLVVLSTLDLIGASKSTKQSTAAATRILLNYLKVAAEHVAGPKG